MADLNPASMEVLTNCLLEPALSTSPIGEVVQFERLGYFCRDRDGTPSLPIFTRTVSLRDSWAKVQSDTAKSGRKGDPKAR
jgi:glutaminyl-tRNA synthetase